MESIERKQQFIQSIVSHKLSNWIEWAKQAEHKFDEELFEVATKLNFPDYQKVLAIRKIQFNPETN